MHSEIKPAETSRRSNPVQTSLTINLSLSKLPMASSGSAATRWISCDIELINAVEWWSAQNGSIEDSVVHRLEVVAELDTGSRQLGLQREQIQALNLKPLKDPVVLQSVLDKKKHSVTLYGPVSILFQGQMTTVEAYELKFAPWPLLGLEAAKRMKIEIDWKNMTIFLPTTGYTHNAFTIAPEDLPSLFGKDSVTIIAQQKKYKVSIEINNRRKVDKIVVIICTDQSRDNITQAAVSIKEICPSLMPAPEEERE